MTRIVLLFLSFFHLQIALGQTIHSGRLKNKNILLSECSFILDSLTIIPSSIIILHSVDQDTIKGFTVSNNVIFVEEVECSKLLGQHIIVQYRTFDFDIGQKYFHLDSMMMRHEDRLIYIGSDYSTSKPSSKIIDANGLDYNGSFSRGFSVGNSQSLILNSNFNLQLAGELGNGLSITAAISDDNIPIQPEGNTQLIQEFDRVFIKLDKGKTSFTAGDYNLERPKSYFVNYFKKVKGLSANTEVMINENASLVTNGSFAISRGKFARQIVNTAEGNQGPYKLIGNNSERFLIVLSGSEKIYLDGILLERGLEYDYVIDYNRAEVTFTPKRLIARESRVIVEFEYRDQNYLRSIYAANTYFSNEKLELNLNFYNEQDSKSVTGDILLDSTDVALLASVGDNIDNASISSERMVTDSLSGASQVKYRKNTNVVFGDPDDYFLEFSNDFSEVLFVASFVEVGLGKGRYVIDDQSIVNGRIYKYVGPGNGQYEPLVSLTPPEKKQVISLGAKYKPTRNIALGGELSLSNNDINRFASIGNDDNLGAAAVFFYDQVYHFDSSKLWQIKTENKYEHLGQNFRVLNPYRPAEFVRNWNINNQLITADQNLLSSTWELSRREVFKVQYSYDIYDIKSLYQGVNQRGQLEYKYKGFQFNSTLQSLDSEGFGEKTNFVRPNATISQVIHKQSSLRLGATYDAESNKRRLSSSPNELTNESFAFDLIRFFISNDPSYKWHYKLQYSDRNDLFDEGNVLNKSINTGELNLLSQFKFSNQHNLDFNIGYRNFDVLREDLLPMPLTDKKTIVGKLDHNISAWDGFLVSSSSYLINSGQEPKVEYFFEKVLEGQGDYIYIGNQDSILINANFRYAPTLGTANYIRLSLINNEFVSTDNQSLSQSLRIEPQKLLKDSKGKLVKYFSKLSYSGNYRVNKKVEDDGSNQQTSFLNFTSDDPNLVTYSSILNNTLFINKGSIGYDAQFGNRKSSNIFTQISGREERKLSELFSKIRIRIMDSSDFLLGVKEGSRTYDSAIFPSRNLDIRFYAINPEISIRPSSTLRFNINYTYDDRRQMINDKEKATSHDFSLSTTYRQTSNTNINLTLSFINVSFDGIDNSPVEFDILEGLKDGKNYLWNMVFTKRLSTNIDLNLSYEGRKNGIAPTVHIARAQMKATF